METTVSAWPKPNRGLNTTKSFAVCERVRSNYRSGPLFQLHDHIDTSKIAADGSLIRSDRLARLEAVLLISPSSLPAKKIAQLARLVDANEAQTLIRILNKSYDATQSAFRVEESATGFQLMTRPHLVTWLDRLHERQSQMKLSQPMMETLTIVAYQQPITRVGVEGIRGVQSSEMIRQLIDRKLVKVGGEEDSLGRPFLYVTTREFLDMFGLSHIRDLPNYESMKKKVEKPPEDVAPEAETTDSDEAASSETPVDEASAGDQLDSEASAA